MGVAERERNDTDPSDADPNRAEGPQSPRERWLTQWERATEVPLVALAVLMIPLLLLPELVHLAASWRTAFAVANVVIWGAFAVDLVVRFGLTTPKRGFLRRNWADVLIVVVPFLRPLRILRSVRALRLLRLTRLAGFVGFAGNVGHRLWRRHGLRWVVLAGGGFVLVATLVVWDVERSASRSGIHDFGDSVWWAVAATTTVDYGHSYPVTTVGRVLALMVTIVGLTIVTMLTASLAAMFVASDAAKHQEAVSRDELSRKLDEVLERLRALDGGEPAGDPGTA